MIFAPDNARDGVVSVKIALIGQRRERDPRQTAEIDQRVALGCSGEKLRLRPALGACRAAEVLQRVTGRHRHDVELFRTGVQVGEARFTACEQDRLAVSDGISECGRVIDRLRAQPDQSVIKGQAAPFRVSMQCRDVRGDGHAVKRIRQAGEERVCLAPRPGIERDGDCIRSVHGGYLLGFFSSIPRAGGKTQFFRGKVRCLQFFDIFLIDV